MLAYWNLFADNHLLTSMYSIYVLLVLLIVSIIEGNKGAAAALGWVGVAVIATLILTVLFFKCVFLERKQANLSALKIPGIS